MERLTDPGAAAGVAWAEGLLEVLGARTPAKENETEHQQFHCEVQAHVWQRRRRRNELQAIPNLEANASKQGPWKS